MTVSNQKVLAFHKLLPRFSFSSTNFSPHRFCRLLEHLCEQGFSFDSVDPSAPDNRENSLAITFDDGYQHLREYLPDIIAQFGLQPIIFVPTQFIGQPNSWDYSYTLQVLKHLDEKSIRALADAGADFGSHGHSHHPLTRFTGERLKDELVRSKKTLEDILGRAVTTISYPFGSVNRRVIQAAEEAGFTAGFTTEFPTESDSALSRGRYAIYGYDTSFTIRQKLTDGRLYWLERTKSRLTNRLSAGTGVYRRLLGR